jgi:rare lipoprotein A
MRLLLILISLLIVAGCQSSGKKPKHPASASKPSSSQTQASFPTASSTGRGNIDPCAPIHQHDEKHYTAGGLYAPHLSDTAPVGAIDISKLIEPTPKAEEKSRYGNRSPYTVLGKQYWVMPNANGYDQRGIASWYGQKFNGRKTSSGEIYSVCEFTAAHKTLPLPSIVRVTHLGNGRSVLVRVNDRGPFHQGRIIDLSYAAAVKLGLDKTGTASVRVQAVQPDGSVSDIEPRASESVNTTSSTPSVSATSNTALTVQFGSFAQRDNADRLMNRLRAANITGVELVSSQTQQSTLWRVLAVLADEQALETILEKSQQMGLPKPVILNQKL